MQIDPSVNPQIRLESANHRRAANRKEGIKNRPAKEEKTEKVESSGEPKEVKRGFRPFREWLKECQSTDYWVG